MNSLNIIFFGDLSSGLSYADWPCSRLCWTSAGLRHIALRHCASTRGAAAMLISYGPAWPHLTLSSGTIYIPAALSLPPYQCGDRDIDTNLNPQCKSEEEVNQFIKSKWSINIQV